ncbi:disulfide bond formation protein B [Agarivorans sp. JK6]|uniref:disulfide bond formation protein B n=1 Tax=Agarivorans sp. JK6 TaxID=2997426 RepID=UPI003873BFB3
MNNKQNMNSKLKDWLNQPSFGYFIFGIFLFMEGFGLYVQYGLGDEPCANCVMVRAYLLLVALSAVVAIVTSNEGKLSRPVELTRLCVVYFLATAGLGLAFYHSYDNYLIESGRLLFSTCSLSSPFPAWLPLDTLLPALFEANALCGTPAYLFDWLTFTELSLIGLPIVFIGATLLYTNAMWQIFKQ